MTQAGFQDLHGIHFKNLSRSCFKKNGSRIFWQNRNNEAKSVCVCGYKCAFLGLTFA